MSLTTKRPPLGRDFDVYSAIYMGKNTGGTLGERSILNHRGGDQFSVVEWCRGPMYTSGLGVRTLQKVLMVMTAMVAA